MRTMMNLGGAEIELDLTLPGDALRPGILLDPGKMTSQEIDVPEGSEALLVDDRMEVFFVGDGRVRPTRPWRFAAILEDGWSDLNLVGAACSLGPVASADVVLADRIIEDVCVRLRPGIINEDLAGLVGNDPARLSSIIEREACSRVRLLVRGELRRLLQT